MNCTEKEVYLKKKKLTFFKTRRQWEVEKGFKPNTRYPVILEKVLAFGVRPSQKPCSIAY